MQKTIEITHRNIEDIKADIIVNAADNYLWFGDGVDGALRQRGGFPYIKACQEVIKKQPDNYIATGDVIIMNSAFPIKAKYVIHAVSPSVNMKHYKSILRKVVDKIITLSVIQGAKTVAIPLLGSGAFRIPKQESLKVITDTITNFNKKYPYCRKMKFIISAPSLE